VTFLAPIAGLIAAAAVLPPLLVFYMLKLRRRPVRVSSTMLWEQAAADLQANVPLKWLRPSWLLFLQLLAVGMLLAAVARPAIEGAGPISGRVLLVIDASASMAAPTGDADNPSTRLADAKARALEVVRAAERSAQEVEIGVIVMAGEACLLATPTSDRAAVRRALDSIEVAEQPADFGAALNLVAAQTLRAEDGAAAPRTNVVLISDGALAPAPPDAPGLRDATFQFVRVGPPPEAVRDNLGFSTVSAVRDFDRPEIVRVFARLVSAAELPVSAPVTIRLDGRAVRAVTVPVAPAQDGFVGEGLLAAQFEDSAGGALTLSLELADELASDDVAALRLPRAGAARVLLVSEGRADPFLVRALSAAIGREIEATTLGEYTERARNPRWPASFDLIVFLAAQPEAPPTVGTLTFAAPVPGGSIALAPVDDPTLARRLISWRRTHPLLRHVALDQLVIAPRNVLAMPDGPAAAQIESIAMINEGPVIAVTQDGSARRAVVAFAPEDSSWPVDVSFAVFIANAVSYLAPGALGAEAGAETTAEPLFIRAAPGADRITAIGPVAIAADVPEGAATVSLGLPTRTGIYRVQGAVADDAIVGVSLFNELESSIATRDAVELPGGASRPAVASAAGAQEIWRWFVLAGFILLTLEWLVYAWRMRI
jgi:hypothetical protein